MNNIIEIRVLEPNEVVNCLKIDITVLRQRQTLSPKRQYIKEERCWVKRKKPFLE